MTRRIALLTLVVSLIWLAGCGGGQGASPPAPSTSRGAPASTAEGTAVASGQTGQGQGGTTSYEDYCIEKQFAEATRGMSPQEVANYETQVINEAVARALDPRTVLIERGFYC